MVAPIRCCDPAQLEALAELRLLLELPAVRRLADRGLVDEELALVRKLADATTRAARCKNVPGYLQADKAFHRCLLELTGDPALSGIAQLLLVAHPRCAERVQESSRLMVREGREHQELVGLVASGMVSAADQLLRLHLARRSAGRPVLPRLDEPEPTSFARG